MAIVRKLFNILFVFLLSSLAFSSIVLITVTLIFTNRENIKSWPVRADVYTNLVEVGFGLITQQENNEEVSLEEVLEGSALDAGTIKGIFKEQFSPEYLESKFNLLFDATYDWLEGKTEQLTFTISLADKTDQLVDGLADEVEVQLRGLPECTQGQITPEFDVLGATCLPPGITPTMGAALLKHELGGDESFLNDFSFSDKDIFNEKTDVQNLGEELTQENVGQLDRSDVEKIPEYYSWLGKLPYILSGILLVLIGLATVTSKSILAGLKRSGQTLFSAGVMTWIGFFLANRFGATIPTDSFGGSQEAEFANTIMVPLVNTIIKDVSITGIWVSLTVLIIGIVIWLGSYFWHKVHHHHEAEMIAKKAAAEISVSHPQLFGSEAKLPEPKNEVEVDQPSKTKPTDKPEVNTGNNQTDQTDDQNIKTN